jgi:hypothetical protein
MFNNFFAQIKFISGYPMRRLRSPRKTLISLDHPDIFTKIYEQNSWGGAQSSSGTGSDSVATKELISFLPILLNKYKIESLLDLPCGDFTWMRSALSNLNIKYIGADIVPKIISNLTAELSPTRDFRVMDITGSSLPMVDLVFCRDLLFHLSIDDCLKAIDNVLSSKSTFFMTSSHAVSPRFKNIDCISGDYRKIDLFKAPFNFPPPLEVFKEFRYIGQPQRHLYLWRIASLKKDKNSK